MTIDRDSGVVEVRPLRRRKVFRTTLACLADIAVQRQVQAELREKKALKAKNRKSRRTKI